MRWAFFIPVGFIGECSTTPNKALRKSPAMVKTLVRSKHSVKQPHPVMSPIKRDFSPEEFDADTEEDRPITVLEDMEGGAQRLGAGTPEKTVNQRRQ